MHDRFIRQAYEELTYLRDCLASAERYHVRSDDLRRRIASSEARIKVLELAKFNANRN